MSQEKPPWFAIVSTLLLFAFLFGLPSYPLIMERFAVVKGDFEATTPGSATFHLVLEKPETLQLRVRYRVMGDAPETLVLTVNNNPVREVRVDRSGEIKTTIPAAVLHAGTNAIRCALASESQRVLFEKVLYRNLYGINPHVPVVNVIFDESWQGLGFPEDTGESALRAARLFVAIVFYLMFVSGLVGFLFYRKPGEFFRGIKCFLLPVAFPWIALIYSAVTPYRVLYPRQTLFWIILAGVVIPHFFVFRVINIQARLRLFRHYAHSAGVPRFYLVLARRVGVAMVIALLFLIFFQLPNQVPIVNDHDKGSQAAYEYWTAHGFAYGKDIIQNVGPLGFLNYPEIYTGFLDLPKMWINLFLTSGLILILWQNSKRLPGAIRVTFLIVTGVFVTNPNVAIYLLLLLIAHQLLFTSSIGFLVLALLLLAVLALAKGTCFFIAGFIVVAAVTGNILARRFTVALLTLAGFVVFLLATWALAGQPLANFPAFAYATAMFSSGYNEALSIFEPRKVLVFGVIALVTGLLSIVLQMLSATRMLHGNIQRIGRKLLLAATESFILFVVWKHGFVRADDSHVVIFFQYVLVCSIWILYRREPPDSRVVGSVPENMRKVSAVFGMVIVIASFIGLHFNPETMLRQRYSKITDTWSGIVNVHAYFNGLRDELSQSMETMRLPKTRAMVGKASISYFGIYPAVMLYNDLNYVSTPSTISFASWNEWIMAADAEFFRDEKRAPDYLLYDLKTTDNRLVAQDNSLAQLEILRRYEIVEVEAGNILLRRVKGRAPISRKLLSQRDYPLGAWIDVPQAQSGQVWVKAKMENKTATQIMALIYKPPQYRMEVMFADGGTKTYKFIPRMAATGFLINPFIAENRDLLVFKSWNKYLPLADGTNPMLALATKFRIVCAQESLEAFCGGAIAVAFEEVLVPAILP